MWFYRRRHSMTNREAYGFAFKGFYVAVNAAGKLLTPVTEKLQKILLDSPGTWQYIESAPDVPKPPAKKPAKRRGRPRKATTKTKASKEL